MHDNYNKGASSELDQIFGAVASVAIVAFMIAATPADPTPESVSITPHIAAMVPIYPGFAHELVLADVKATTTEVGARHVTQTRFLDYCQSGGLATLMNMRADLEKGPGGFVLQSPMLRTVADHVRFSSDPTSVSVVRWEQSGGTSVLTHKCL